MKDIKICLISDTVFDLNGVSRFIQDMVKQSTETKKDFVVITSTNKNDGIEYQNILNLKPIFKIKMPFYNSLDLVFPNFFKIYKAIKLVNPDIIHISTPGTVGLCGLISAKLLKKPIAGIYHTDFPQYIYKNTNSKILKFISKKYLQVFYRNFKIIFSRSSSYRDIISKDINFKIENIIDFKYGIDLNKYNKSHKDIKIWNKFNIRENNFKVLYVGRISKEKNIDKLIKVWKAKYLSMMDLILVGDDELGIDKDKLLKYNIHFLGRQKGLTLSKIYASSNCFIFPSTTDTLGQVVLEALASGLPAIVTNQGGPKEFVSNDYGYVLDINDRKSWIKAVKELYFKEKIYKSKSQKACNIMQKYNISNSFLDFWDKNQKLCKNS